VKQKTAQWLKLKDDRIIDVTCGTYIANQLDCDPVWLTIIGPASSAKTEVLTAAGRNEGGIVISGFTRSTLVSGHKAKDAGDSSLVHRINGKVLVVKEFGSVLSMNSDDQKAVLSQLREIYDGHLYREFGNGKKVLFQGRCGFIGATTPAYDRHHSVIGSLGDRFLLYRHHNSNQEETGEKALGPQFGQEVTMRKELNETYTAFLKQFRPMPPVDFVQDETVDSKIVQLAIFCAHGRCAVERDRYSQAIEYIPEAEGAPRVSKQLKSLGVGIALAHGKHEIDEDVYSIIKKVGHDLIETRRIICLKHLWQEQRVEFLGWANTREIADAIGIPAASARLILEDLQIVGLLNKRLKDAKDEDEDDPKGRKPYEWQIKQDAENWIKAIGVFDDLDESLPF
jgi:hypothetical protein